MTPGMIADLGGGAGGEQRAGGACVPAVQQQCHRRQEVFDFHLLGSGKSWVEPSTRASSLSPEVLGP